LWESFWVAVKVSDGSAREGSILTEKLEKVRPDTGSLAKGSQDAGV
jgi:hypothetical protein